MTVADKMDIDAPLGRAIKSSIEVSSETRLILSEMAPIIRLASEMRGKTKVIRKYLTVREAFLASGGWVVREEYNLAKTEVRDLAKHVDRELRDVIEKHMDAWDSFINAVQELKTLKTESLRSKTVAKRLSKKNKALLFQWRHRVHEMEDLLSEDIRAAYQYFIRVVNPENEAGLALLMNEARRIAEKHRNALTELSVKSVEKAFGGDLNRLQGLMFELFSRRSMEMLDQVDFSLRSAATRAVRRGPEWDAYRVNGELRLVAASPEKLQKIKEAGPLSLSDLPFKQFADDGTLAIKFGPDGLLEIDASAFMEFKAVDNPTELAKKLDDFVRRLTGGKKKEILILHFKWRDGKDAFGILRPLDASDQLTFYAVGTSGKAIPNATKLRELGIDQKNLALDLGRDELRVLAEQLLLTAFANPI